MIVNLDVDGYTNPKNHRKIIRNTQNNNNLRRSKRILQSKCKLNGGLFFTFILPLGRAIPPS